MRLVLLGPPGAGKGTQSAWLIAYLKIPHLSTGDMLRAAARQDNPTGREVAKYLESGGLVPDPIVLCAVEERLREPDCRVGYLFDGFPRTLVQAEALDAMLAAQGTPLNAVLELAVDEHQLVDRLTQRGRDDDRIETIAHRLQVYRRQTSPLINYYFHQGNLKSINGNGTPEQVRLQIKSIVDHIAVRQQ